MKMRVFLLLLLSSFFLRVSAQYDSTEFQKLHKTAKEYIMGGDFNNGIVVLNRLLQQDPQNLEVLKDLAYAYYLKKDLVSAMTTAEPLAGRADADVQTYQILGLIYKALDDRKQASRMYKSALRKFPRSGALYNEYGELQWAAENFSDAIKTWEKGIESDPNYSGNYYNAAKYYYFSRNKVWGLVYGEIFINLESYSTRTKEIKKLLLDGYKKLFSDTDIFKDQPVKNDFVKTFLSTMQRHAADVNGGITMESLHTLRMNFIRDWDQGNAARFPSRLFQHQNQMLEMGLLEAYDEWIFADLFKPGAFESWGENHLKERTEFLRLQQNRVFKIPLGQYYQTASR